MAAKAITTLAAKRKMLLARAGKQALPPIKQMVFGAGGVTEAGEVLELEEGQQELKDEIFRKDIEKIEVINNMNIQYCCTLDENELSGADISEIALADEEGDLVAIKNFKAKGKDNDFSMTFKINDTM